MNAWYPYTSAPILFFQGKLFVFLHFPKRYLNCFQVCRVLIVQRRSDKLLLERSVAVIGVINDFSFGNS